MVTYQTALYKVKYLDAQFGWDYDELIFEPRIHEEPWKAMMEFDFHEPVSQKLVCHNANDSGWRNFGRRSF